MRRAFEFDLDGFTDVVPADPIQAKAPGRSRALNGKEALSLAAGVFGTLGRTRGVKIANAKFRGIHFAVALIEDARFGEDAQGATTLSDQPAEKTK